MKDLRELKKIGPAFALIATVGLSGCADPVVKIGFDIAYDSDDRKELLIDGIAQNSFQMCKVSNVYGDDLKYDNALKSILGNMDSHELDFYVNNNITICLDERLSNLRQDIFDYDAYAMFYPSTYEPVVSLWYNGETGSGYGAFFLEELHYQYENEGHSINTGPIDMGYISYCGANCVTADWADANSFEVVHKNPAIKRPSLRW